jgi:hypothetical protein
MLKPRVLSYMASYDVASNLRSFFIYPKWRSMQLKFEFSSKWTVRFPTQWYNMGFDRLLLKNWRPPFGVHEKTP